MIHCPSLLIFIFFNFFSLSTFSSACIVWGKTFYYSFHLSSLNTQEIAIWHTLGKQLWDASLENSDFLISIFPFYRTALFWYNSQIHTKITLSDLYWPVIFSVFTELHRHHHKLNLDHFPHIGKKTHAH